MSYTKTVTGRNAPAKPTPTQAALRSASLQAGTAHLSDWMPELTNKEAAAVFGASLTYHCRAKRILPWPVLWARVERGELSLAVAAESLRSHSKPPQPALTLLEQFAKAGALKRAECMRAFIAEAFELIDSTTAPGNGVSKPNGMFAQH